MFTTLGHRRLALGRPQTLVNVDRRPAASYKGPDERRVNFREPVAMCFIRHAGVGAVLAILALTCPCSAEDESAPSTRPFHMSFTRWPADLTLEGFLTAQEFALRAATRDRYEFVIQFATTDFERLCDKLPPPVDDLARIWAYTGMQTSDKKPKPALALWDAYLNAKFSRSK